MAYWKKKIGKRKTQTTTTTNNKQPTTSARASWESKTFLNKYFLSRSFLLCSTGSLGQVKNMITNIFSVPLALKTFPCCLLTISSGYVIPRAGGMKLKISTVLLNTQKQATIKKEKTKHFFKSLLILPSYWGYMHIVWICMWVAAHCYLGQPQYWRHWYVF